MGWELRGGANPFFTPPPDNRTTESTVLVRVAADRSPDNPGLLYGVATYFWNFVHDAVTARGYQATAATAAVRQVINAELSATVREDAMTVIKNVAVLIPEDKPQIVVVNTLVAHELWDELREILFFLFEAKKMGG